MNKKILLQILILLIIILLIIFFYTNYFNKKEVNDYSQSMNQVETEQAEIKGNYIKEITYKSRDNKNREYIIKSKSGYIDENNSEIIHMNDVKAEIMLIDNSVINILSKKAVYNSLNYDTKFKNGTTLAYLEHEINSENLNLSFQNNTLEAFENLTYRNDKSVTYADKVTIDLITKNTKIFNLDESNVKIIFSEQNN